MPDTVPGQLPHGCKISKSGIEEIVNRIEIGFSPAADRKFLIVRRGNEYDRKSLTESWEAARKPGVTDNLEIDVKEGGKRAYFKLSESGVKWSATGDGYFPAGLKADIENILGDAIESSKAQLFSRIARVSSYALLVAFVVAAIALYFLWSSNRAATVAVSAFVVAATAGIRWFSQWKLKSSVIFDPGAWTPWNRSDKINAGVLAVSIASLVVAITALAPGSDAGSNDARSANGISPSVSGQASPSESSTKTSTFQISPTAGPPGTTIEFTGSGFSPDKPVVVELHDGPKTQNWQGPYPKSFTADKNGKISGWIKVENEICCAGATIEVRATTTRQGWNSSSVDFNIT
ncbi:hypothetical protein [Streptomyces sp. AC555_RSS877]|uniref:hypothetical protein n=1 Tax=Streptomyces sp. AC555_RSS877 TaxID=2823688 RepID=UPI001C271FFF|nr:hypothetical protein [Streptomyces sp. AC555_RSS877]